MIPTHIVVEIPSYPKAKKHRDLEIPVKMMSGGTLKRFGDNPIEYRVWMCCGSGDDNYVSFTTYPKALKFSKEQGTNADKPIAVVWDSNFNGFREVSVT